MVVAVLAVLAGIAVPRLGVPFASKMKVKTAARRVMSDLRYARRLSITNNANHRLSIDSSLNEYAVYDALSQQVGETQKIDSDVMISADKTFTFESLGNPAVSSDTSLSLTYDGNQADISVTKSTGYISVIGP